MIYHGDKEKLTELRGQLKEYRQAKKSAPIVLITAYHIIISSK